AQHELSAAGADPAGTRWELALEMRYLGQSHNVGVTMPLGRLAPELEATVRAGFEARYRQLYGALVPGAAPEVVVWRLIGRSERGRSRFAWADGRADRQSVEPRTRRPIFIPALRDFAPAPVFERYALAAGTTLTGPLVLEERESTIVVAEPARVHVMPDLAVRIELPKEQVN